ncbi:phenylacetate--CoA ligase family protein [uncultured Finegoldia sp.]|uniref:phenylacetate--CoA ligase family protein n=1 Tax=uncultured Finegoldia sp. TaxID=328009 RepID=UPI0026321A61|nr:AMP-binding protein [uncultured Finegoldia sp.]
MIRNNIKEVSIEKLESLRTSKYWEEEFETLSREEIEKLQLQELKTTLIHAYENSEYYRKKFDEKFLNPYEFSSLEELSKYPFVNKKTERDTQHKGSFLGQMACTSEDDVVFISASSGSTGIPTISPFTQRDFDEFQNIQSRLFYQIGMRKNDRYVHALNFSLFVGGPDVIGAQNVGALCVWAGTIPSEKLINIIVNYKPTIIWTTPSYAWYLGESAKKLGYNPKELSLKKIIVAGEPGGSIEATREKIEELWDADLYDFYGLSDIFGACAGMCEEKDGLHIAEDQILVEVINPETGEVLPEGEIGELVFTSLRKQARPMIRFRTGDIGYINKNKCKCGRTSTRIYIVGRLDDMFIVSGVNVFPSDVEHAIRQVEGITGEYRIRIFNKNLSTAYSVEVEKTDDVTDEEKLKENIWKILKVNLGVKPADILIHEDGYLPRQTHKANRIIDERK